MAASHGNNLVMIKDRVGDEGGWIWQHNLRGTSITFKYLCVAIIRTSAPLTQEGHQFVRPIGGIYQAFRSLSFFIWQIRDPFVGKSARTEAKYQ